LLEGKLSIKETELFLFKGGIQDGKNKFASFPLFSPPPVQKQQSTQAIIENSARMVLCLIPAALDPTVLLHARMHRVDSRGPKLRTQMEAEVEPKRSGGGGALGICGLRTFGKSIRTRVLWKGETKKKGKGATLEGSSGLVGIKACKL
jgi:hypothetical protein